MARLPGEVHAIPNPEHCCACAAERHADRVRRMNVESATMLMVHGADGRLSREAEAYLLRIFTATELPSFK